LLIRALQDLSRDPVAALVSLGVFVFALLIAFSVHECCHALVATYLGDRTPRSQGRLTLNPLAHLDPMGTAMMLIVGFGWAKPVQVNPKAMSIRPRAGVALVSIAGPLSNFALAGLLAIPYRTGAIESVFGGFSLFNSRFDSLPGFVVGTIIFVNLLLAAFNLLPIAPLDGFKVALGLLPRDLASGFARLEPFGPAVLLMMIAIDWVVPGANIIGRLIRPLVNLMSTVILGGSLW